jgi:uncharacterized integral membrane protein
MPSNTNAERPLSEPLRPDEQPAPGLEAGSGQLTSADHAIASTSPSAKPAGETGRARFRRRAHRSRLHGYAILTVALVAFLIALAVSNTAAVKVSWVFGSSHVSLVWLVLFAAILGWLLGLVATAAFHWRTRAPRRGRTEPRP